jgi:hypothetical protein
MTRFESYWRHPLTKFVIFGTLIAAYTLFWTLNWPLGDCDDEYFLQFRFAYDLPAGLRTLFDVGGLPEATPRLQSVLFYPGLVLGLKASLPETAPMEWGPLFELFRGGKFVLFVFASLLATTFAWAIYRLTRSCAITAIAVFLLITSPQMTLWASRYDSRMICLIPFLLAFVWTIDILREPERPAWAKPLVTGMLFCISVMLYYTAAYLMIVVIPLLWLVAFVSSRKKLMTIRLGLTQAVGFMSPFLFSQALALWLKRDYPGVTLPIETYATIYLRHKVSDFHAAMGSRISFWTDGILTSHGWILPVVVLLGSVLFVIRFHGRDALPRRYAVAIVAACIAGGPIFFLYLFNESQFVRQSAAYQLFYFCFAAVAITFAMAWIRPLTVRVAAMAILTIAVSWHQMGVSAEVTRGINGYRMMASWLDKNAEAYAKKGHVHWLAGKVFYGMGTINSWSEFSRLPPDELVVSPAPTFFLVNNRYGREYLDALPVLKEFPSLESISVARFEAMGPEQLNDSKAKGVISAIRLHRTNDVIRSLPQARLSHVTARFGAETSTTELPADLVQRLLGSSGATFGRSGPVELIFSFDQTIDLSALQFFDLNSMKTARFTVHIETAGEWRLVASSDDPPSQHPWHNDFELSWAPVATQRVKLTILKQQAVFPNDERGDETGLKLLSFPPYRTLLSEQYKAAPSSEAGGTLTVSRLTCSSFEGLEDGSRLFDQQMIPDQRTWWMSASSDPTPWIEIEFGKPVVLDQIKLTQSPAYRLGGVSIHGKVGDTWTLLRETTGLHSLGEPLIAFASTEVTALRLDKFTSWPGGGPGRGLIGELTFPGFRIRAPNPSGNCQVRF